MPKITFVEHNGTIRHLEVEDGVSVMEAAVQNFVPGIDGDCGGASACATCHVHIDAQWLSKLPAISDLENSMLELAPDRDERSRLGCQLKLDQTLDGIVVITPEAQH